MPQLQDFQRTSRQQDPTGDELGFSFRETAQDEKTPEDLIP
jgi:hypothetical protein